MAYLTAFQSVRTIIDVKDCRFFGDPQSDMGNVGLGVVSCFTASDGRAAVQLITLAPSLRVTAT